jgi:hypothetical protein
VSKHDEMPYRELGFWGRYWRRVRAAKGSICPGCFDHLAHATHTKKCARLAEERAVNGQTW